MEVYFGMVVIIELADVLKTPVLAFHSMQHCIIILLVMKKRDCIAEPQDDCQGQACEQTHLAVVLVVALVAQSGPAQTQATRHVIHVDSSRCPSNPGTQPAARACDARCQLAGHRGRDGFFRSDLDKMGQGSGPYWRMYHLDGPPGCLQDRAGRLALQEEPSK